MGLACCFGPGGRDDTQPTVFDGIVDDASDKGRKKRRRVKPLYEMEDGGTKPTSPPTTRRPPETIGETINVPGAVDSFVNQAQPVLARQGSKTSFDVEGHLRSLIDAKKLATASEDYDKAGQLKEEIDRFESVKGQLKQLMLQKEKAVEREDYEEASFLKKEITEIIDDQKNLTKKKEAKALIASSSSADPAARRVELAGAMAPAGFVGGALPPARSLEELASELDDNNAPVPQQKESKELSPKAGKSEVKENFGLDIDKNQALEVGAQTPEDDDDMGPMDTNGEDLIKQVFDVLDEDSNGFISSEEARRFIDLTTVGLEESQQQSQIKDSLINAFSQMDTNHDSEISYDEWRKGFSKLLKVYKAEQIEGPMLDAIYQLDDSCC